MAPPFNRCTQHFFGFMLVVHSFPATSAHGIQAHSKMTEPAPADDVADGGDGGVLAQQRARVAAWNADATVHRAVRIGPTVVTVIGSDIAAVAPDVIVNAANQLSFMPMDNGVSGALRRASQPDDVTKKPKRYWDADGTMHEAVKVPTLQAGVQPAAGGLRARGVKFIVHAVGPTWTDWTIGDGAFKAVPPRIKRTVRNALAAATRVGAQSCVMPAISGGIFTHWREGSDIKLREQRAARVAVVQAVVAWLQSEAGGATTLRTLDLCDLGGRSGQLGMFMDAFDEVVRGVAAAE